MSSLVFGLPFDGASLLSATTLLICWTTGITIIRDIIPRNIKANMNPVQKHCFENRLSFLRGFFPASA
ncbi:hypothetical protein K502DRAFT_323418 [Neoconidiobolus thromboides FSU 785]|nr:hypothetical protein K502DRAFT_323418 [Neoconidiobolus thromboides FSU 785]